MFFTLTALLALGNFNTVAATSLRVGATDEKDINQEVLITMKNIQHDGGDQYIKTLEEAYVKAFNTVHSAGRVTMKSFDLKKEIDVPEGNSPGADDLVVEGANKVEEVGMYKTYLWGTFGASCNVSLRRFSSYLRL